MTSMSPDAATWLKVIHDSLAALEQGQLGSSCPVVDHEVITAVTGSFEDTSVWLICRTPAERTVFTDTELPRFSSALRRQLLHAGLPESLVAGLTIRVTSREEIGHGGAPFPSFR